MATCRIQARAIGVIATGYLTALVAYVNLPHGVMEDRLSGRMLVTFTLPTAALAIYAIFRSLWKHDFVRTGNGAFECTYHAILLRVLLFILALHALVLMELTRVIDAFGLHESARRAVVVLLGTVFVATGNLLPRTRPNVAVGLRTPRTLNNTQLWQQVHRAGGNAAVGLGFVIALSGLILTRDAVGPVVGVAAVLAAVSVLISYRKHAHA